MAYVTVPKDLTKIKSKMLFGLTKRQLVCFGSAALVGVPLFFLSKGSMGTTSAALCMILAYVTNADPGNGLLFFQNVILPFKDEFPKTTELYRLLTTKPSEVSHDGETG